MKTLPRILFAAILFLISSRCFAGPLVQFKIFYGTSFLLGEVDVELYDKDKPVTSSNFVYLVQSGAYVNGFLHRCIPGFVIQGGGFYAIQPTLTNVFSPYVINLQSVYDPYNITNEYGVGKFYSNTNWTISMAKSSDPNSANSQFFFNIANNSGSLDDTNNSGGFTVFGHTVRGTNILNFFNFAYNVQNGYGIADETKVYGTNNATANFTTLPNIYSSGAAAPPFNDLFYYTINVLTLKAKLTNSHSVFISWNSVNGVTNNLEYTTNVNSSWVVLTNPVGNGLQMSYTDIATNTFRHFYRIHPLF